MSAKSSSGVYKSIKDLVFNLIHVTNGTISYEHLTREVHMHFPDSAWKKTHWSYYRSQIKAGKHTGEFSSDEVSNLLSKKGRKSKDNREVKVLGDEILEQTREAIEKAAKGNAGLKFKLNRWVFARLQQDERIAKNPVKKELWDSGMTSCKSCGRKFSSLKGVECHRIDSEREYALENCELLCKACHQKRHAAN